MKNLITLLVAFALCSACGEKKTAISANEILAEQILSDTLMQKVDSMARNVIKGGFNAGSGYGEVWIRDYNTFIELAMEVMPDSAIQDNLLTFFRLQGPTGDIVDGFSPINKVNPEEAYRLSAIEPRYAAHKNTVETDQESSLVQAVGRYVAKSGNRAFLQTEIEGKTVLQRLEWAMEYLMNERYDSIHGLLWGATTADWGDVQPEHDWGVVIDENTHRCIDIYDNAFFIIALNNLIQMEDNDSIRQHWTNIRDQIKQNIRTYLWDEKQQKFIPHLYLEGSPFPADFDESALYFHGGTAIAIEADLLSKEEIATINAAMLANVKESNAPTIGLTVYPPYPEGFFKNKGMYPYGYQNGGDWTWFGGRMINELIRNGFVQEAYDESRPMFERVIKNNGFYEWYTKDNVPSGSGSFRGEAGVLYSVIQSFQQWAQQQKEQK